MGDGGTPGLAPGLLLPPAFTQGLGEDAGLAGLLLLLPPFAGLGEAAGLAGLPAGAVHGLLGLLPCTAGLGELGFGLAAAGEEVEFFLGGVHASSSLAAPLHWANALAEMSDAPVGEGPANLARK